ncbi:MAG TPA: histidine kinase [Actinomycetota bacterium]|nr:histidine kinase [Actinomycetota bacterium]
MDGSIGAAAPAHRVNDRTLGVLAYALGALIVLSFVTQGAFAYLTRNAATVQTSWSSSGLLGFLSVVGLLLFPIVGFILAIKVPRNWIGWIMLLISLSIAVPFDGYAHYALLIRHGELPAGRVLEAISGPFWVPLIMLAGVFLVLLFPDGHVPPGWRWFAWSAGAVMAVAMLVVLVEPGPFETMPSYTNPLGISWIEPFQLLILLIPLSIVGAAISMIQRYRRSTGVERLQLKWLAAAVSVVAITYLIVEPVSALVGFEKQPAWLGALQAFALFTFGLIPVAIGFAILRYRLYEIDVVINRAVLFGAMAVFITAVYVGIVVGVGALVGSRGSPLLSAVAAAIVAIAFQPARRWAQRLADRLVYGKRATPYEILSAFSERLAGAYGDEDLLPRMARILGEGTAADRADVWLKEADRFRPVAGWPTDAPALPAVAVGDAPGLVPVRHQGEVLGALSITKRSGEQVSPTEERLIADLASQAGLVLRNAALIADLRSSRQRLVAAQDEERRKIERNLHDGAQQQLVALAVQLKLARSFVDRDPAKAGAMLDGLQGSAASALEDLRDLARGIYPPLLADQGLEAALDAQARKAAVPVTVESEHLARYPREVESTLYFCALEALNNVAKYAEASSARVRLQQTDGHVSFAVSDDGRGFDPAATGYGTGLQGMADRLAALGGTLDVRSAPGGGTTVAGTLPVGSAPP